MFDNWFEGWAYLLSDDLVSYYSYFTTIFAEIALLWGFGVENTLIYTILLIGCIVNVFLTAFLKGCWFATEKWQRALGRIYAIVFAILFTMGCAIDLNNAPILFVIPLLWTGFAIWIRGYQNSAFGFGFPERVYKISAFIQKPIVLIFSQILLIGLPIVTLGYGIAQIDMAIGYKITITVLSIIFAPLWAYIEDSWATQNIFELVYETD